MKNKHTTLIVTIILVAVLLRLVTSLYLGDTLLGKQKRIQDQVTYNALAQSLLAGKGYSFTNDVPGFTQANHPTAHWSFLYPLYLAGVYAIAGYHPIIARILQAVIAGVLSVWLVYLLGKRLFSKTVGLIAAGLTAVYAYFIFYDAALMTQPFFTVTVLAMLELSLAIIDKLKRNEQHMRVFTPGIYWWFGLGIVLGFGNSSSNYLTLDTIPVFMVCFSWTWTNTPLGSYLTSGIIILLILPWTIRNYVNYHAFLPLNSNAGFALYSANHPYHGTNFDQDYVAPLPSDLMSLGLTAQWSTALIVRGVEFILQDPGRYLLLSLNRVEFFLISGSPQNPTSPAT